ncbi:hypothetical protein AYI68_g6763 [Smittium mucronatum]|uniref:TPX2 C-terminal domain-containing protein n=1 Tax=Smittium mucronatum TaxID=133383 RepID=A0A1R0GQK6_9FUNG|nr:hypothetical protein AYI68_g6763 [Smittium mucronatum]
METPEKFHERSDDSSLWDFDVPKNFDFVNTPGPDTDKWFGKFVLNINAPSGSSAYSWPFCVAFLLISIYLCERFAAALSPPFLIEPRKDTPFKIRSEWQEESDEESDSTNAHDSGYGDESGSGNISSETSSQNTDLKRTVSGQTAGNAVPASPKSRNSLAPAASPGIKEISRIALPNISKAEETRLQDLLNEYRKRSDPRVESAAGSVSSSSSSNLIRGAASRFDFASSGGGDSGTGKALPHKSEISVMTTGSGDTLKKFASPLGRLKKRLRIERHSLTPFSRKTLPTLNNPDSKTALNHFILADATKDMNSGKNAFDLTETQEAKVEIVDGWKVVDTPKKSALKSALKPRRIADSHSSDDLLSLDNSKNSITDEVYEAGIEKNSDMSTLSQSAKKRPLSGLKSNKNLKSIKKVGFSNDTVLINGGVEPRTPASAEKEAFNDLLEFDLMSSKSPIGKTTTSSFIQRLETVNKMSPFAKNNKKRGLEPDEEKAISGNSNGHNKSKKQKSSKLTVPVQLKFKTDVRKRRNKLSSGAEGRELSKNKPSLVSNSNLEKQKTNSHSLSENSSFSKPKTPGRAEAYARKVAKLGGNWTTKPKAKLEVTKPVPFEFKTDMYAERKLARLKALIKEIEEREKEQRKFKAQPIPDYTDWIQLGDREAGACVLPRAISQTGGTEIGGRRSDAFPRAANSSIDDIPIHATAERQASN